MKKEEKNFVHEVHAAFCILNDALQTNYSKASASAWLNALLELYVNGCLVAKVEEEEFEKCLIHMRKIFTQRKERVKNLKGF